MIVDELESPEDRKKFENEMKKAGWKQHGLGWKHKETHVEVYDDNAFRFWASYGMTISKY